MGRFEGGRIQAAIAGLRRREPSLQIGDLFPPIEVELAPYRHLFSGRVLNAGAGSRDLSSLVDGTLVNQDIPEGLHNENINVLSPLDRIPFDDGHFDAVICNAVLEHVRDPHAVVTELGRVLRPGGTLYLGVPFIQPEHLDPTDFQRYTADGLRELVTQRGFRVETVEALHSAYTTLGWVALEWLRAFPGWKGWLLRWSIYPVIRRKALVSTNQVWSIASAYRLVATRA